MSSEKNHYAILGLLRSAEAVVIKAAYRALSHRYHPDHKETGGIDYTTKMAEINEAYRVLSSVDLRELYDRTIDSQRSANEPDMFHPNDAQHSPDSQWTGDRIWTLLVQALVVGGTLAAIKLFT